MELDEAIQGRRSVRLYKKDEVPAEALEAIAEAARWAPSWANFQPARLVAVRDPDAREQVRGCVPEKNPCHAALAQAPVTLVFCGKKGLSGFYKGTARTRHGDYMMFDVGLAVQNAILAAHARGLATCLVGVVDMDRLKSVLGLPDDMDPVVVTPLGYPEAIPAAPPRLPLKEVLRWDRY